jgi:hypothetical protein
MTYPLATNYSDFNPPAVPAAWLNQLAARANVYVDVVADFQADPTGVSDSSTAIQNAINAVGASGGEVAFPPGTYKIGSTLNIGNGSGSTWSTISGVRLKGLSPVGGVLTASPQPKVILNYTGTGTAVSINGPILDWGISNIAIYQAVTSNTGIGLYLNQASYGFVEHLYVFNFGKYGIQITATTVASQANRWDSILVLMPAAAAGSAAIGIRISSDAAGFDVWGDTWVKLYILPAQTTQTGLSLGATDTNFFYHTAIQTAGAKGIVFDYSFNSGQWPGGMFFHGLDLYNNTVTNTGSPFGGLNQTNKCFNYSRVNGAVIPYIKNFQIYDFSPFSRTKMYLTAAQNTTASAGVVNLDTVDVDLDSIADTTNHKITPIRAGVYKVCGQVAVAVGSAGSVLLGMIQKNGATLLGLGYGSNASNQASAYVEAWVTFNGSTDYVQLLQQNTAGTPALQVAQVYYTWMTVEGPF